MRETLHETHTCRDCGAEITVPYVKALAAMQSVDIPALTEAIRVHYTTGRHGYSMAACAGAIAAEYAVLVPDATAVGDGLAAARPEDIFDRLMTLWQEPWSELAFGEAQMLVARLRYVLSRDAP